MAAKTQARAVAKASSSEVDAYVYIKQELKELGWDTRNPLRHPSGRVFTQSECLADPVIKACLTLDRPENIVKVTDSVVWIIEAKRDHKELALAVSEAEGYARKFDAVPTYRARIISGIAGNDIDGYLIETKFERDGRFVPVTMNGASISSFISPETAAIILRYGPDIKDVPIDEALFLTKAERINEFLHLGAINKNYRARVMAALLLALVEGTPPDIDAAPSILIDEINSRARRVLSLNNKPEFFKYIEITLPATEDNHVKFKAALVHTLQELDRLNIRSAMKSGTDVRNLQTPRFPKRKLRFKLTHYRHPSKVVCAG